MSNMFKKNIFRSLVYSLALFACLVSASCSDLNTNYFSGTAIKGVITEGLVKAYAIEGDQELLGEARTDQFGQFTLNTSTDIQANSFLLLELSVDQDTRMRCDLTVGCLDSISGQLVEFGDNIQLPSNFKLQGLASSDANNNISAFISPLSHLVVSTAIQNGQALTTDTIEVATNWVKDAFQLSKSPILTRPIDITQLSNPSFMTDEQLKQSILSAALYPETLLLEWAQGDIAIDSLELKDLLSRATTLTGQLHTLIKESNQNQAIILNRVQSDTQSQLDSLNTSDITILSQPSSTITTEHEYLSLSVQAISDLALSFQWYKDDTPILGANSPIYAKTNSQLGDSGLYHVLISNSSDEQTSLSASLTVNKAEQTLEITQQPRSQSVIEGKPVLLSVGAIGDGSIKYQWYKSDTLIPDATSNSYNIPNSKLQDAGDYRVSVSNGSKQIYSNFVNIWVAAAVKPISISQQPQSRTVSSGEAFNISAFATSEAPLSYQWYKDGAIIPGATASVYSKANSQLSDSGLYRVLISNSTSKQTSHSAAITVNKAEQALEITQQPSSQSISEGDTLSLTAHAIGAGSISYQWQKNGSLIPGAISSSYTLSNSKPQDTGSYRVTVSNGTKQINSDFVNVWVTELVEAISISQQPQPQVIPEGNDAKLTVLANGDGFIRYQWRKNGIKLANAFSASLSITSVSQADSGIYDVLVSNSQGSVTSSPASISVLDMHIPVMITHQAQSQSVLSETPFTLSVSASGDAPISYQWFLDGNAIDSANSAQYQVQSARAADQGNYTVLVSNPSSSEFSEPAFIAVSQPQLGSIELTWDTPTEREDGRPLSFEEIQGYVIEYGDKAVGLQHSLNVDNQLPNSSIIYDLLPGTLFLRIATVDSDGVQGTFSETISITIP